MLKDYNKYKITYGLIFLCIFIYIITFFLYGVEMSASDAIEFFGYNPIVIIYSRQYYRFLTANFIHFGLFHLIINCYSLRNVGFFVETVLKKRNYIIVIITSMFFTTFIPFLLFLLTGYGYNHVSGGISGVICGMLGSIMAMAMLYKGKFKDIFSSLLPSIAFMVFISIAFKNVDFVGHMSGMLGGFLSSYLLIRRKKKSIIH